MRKQCTPYHKQQIRQEADIQKLEGKATLSEKWQDRQYLDQLAEVGCHIIAESAQLEGACRL